MAELQTKVAIGSTNLDWGEQVTFCRLDCSQHPGDMGSPKLEDDNIAFCVLMSETVTELRTLLCTAITHHEGYHSAVLAVNNLLQLSQLPPVSDSLATNPSLHLFGGPLQTCRSGNGHSEVVNR